MQALHGTQTADWEPNIAKNLSVNSTIWFQAAIHAVLERGNDSQTS
jgi:hypothetical protein